MNSKLMFFLIFTFLFCSAVAAQTDKLDEAIRKQMTERNIAGTSVVVVRNSKVVFKKGYGLANVEKSNPVTPNTKFQIASATKPFTASAVMLLVEDGKISLDNKAAKYLSKLPAQYGEVTVRQILTQTSGVSRDLRTGNNDDFTIDQFWQRLATAPISFKPGARWEYSNTNYILLTMMIEAVSKKSYIDFMRERIFKPLKMKDTAYLEPPANNKNRAVGYDWTDNAFRPSPYFSGGFGAGGLVSTVTDMAKWNAALDAGKLLKRDSLEQIFTPAKFADGRIVNFDFRDAPTSYGFGWFLTNYKGHKMVAHGGVLSGFSSQMLRFPDDKIMIIVICNGKSGADRIGYAEYVAQTVANFYVPNLSAMPDNR